MIHLLRRREVNMGHKNSIETKPRVAVGKDREIIYEPIHAHAVAMERKQHAWMSKQPLTNKNIYRYVLEHLRSGWSPERLHRITANEVVLAAKKIFTPLPVHARRSTTLDNGSEHTDHKEFGIQAYFADPYASWQRGGQ